MRFSDATTSIDAWCTDLSVATGRVITLDQNARKRLGMMPYENRHTYLRRFAENILSADVVCPSGYLIGMLHRDRFRTDYPWEIYRRPWIMPEGSYATEHYIYPFVRKWQHPNVVNTDECPAAAQAKYRAVSETPPAYSEAVLPNAVLDPIVQSASSSSSSAGFLEGAAPPVDAPLLTPAQTSPNPPRHRSRRSLLLYSQFKFFGAGEALARTFLSPAVLQQVISQSRFFPDNCWLALGLEHTNT